MKSRKTLNHNLLIQEVWKERKCLWDVVHVAAYIFSHCGLIVCRLCLARFSTLDFPCARTMCCCLLFACTTDIPPVSSTPPLHPGCGDSEGAVPARHPQHQGVYRHADRQGVHRAHRRPPGVLVPCVERCAPQKPCEWGSWFGPSIRKRWIGKGL